jgi:uncharacterized membrane protein
MWIQPGNSFLTKENFFGFLEKITPDTIKKWDSNPFYSKHPKFVKFCGIAILECLNAVISTFLPGNIYILGISVPFGLYGLDRYISCRRNAWSRIIWLGFLLVLGISIFSYFYTPVRYVGPVALFPCLYLALLRFDWEMTRRGIVRFLEKLAFK